MQEKQSILLTCWGTLGEVLPVRRLARHLARQGNRIHVCGPTYARNLFEGIAASFSVIPSGIEQPDSRTEHQIRLMSRRSGVESILADIDENALAATSSIHQVIVREKIDKVIHSWITPAAAIAAQMARVSSVRLCLYPFALNQEADPPVLPRWPRFTSGSKGIAERRKLQADIAQCHRKLIPRLIALGEEAGLEQEAYELLPHKTPSSRRLALFDKRLLLSCDDAPDFITLPAPPTPSIPPELAEFLGRHAAPILISLGSFQALNKQHVITALLSALQSLSLPAVVVLGAPGAWRVIRQRKTLILSSCPLPAAAPHCRLVIHHGGIGSVQETLNAGRVSLTVPLQFDQFDNARRLKALGLGHTAGLGKRDSNSLASLIVHALGDSETAARCKAWNSNVS